MHHHGCLTYICRGFVLIVITAVLAYAVIVWCVSYVHQNVTKYKVNTDLENNVDIFRGLEIRRAADMQLEFVNKKQISEEFQLRIIVIVYNRASSLGRLLEYLNKANYYGDNVMLEVWIDRAKNGTIDAKTYNLARAFKFSHGDFKICNHTRHTGIYGQWMGTWKPSVNSSEIGIFLEDDLSVSPYFYKWLRVVHNKYHHLEHINGFALQGVSITHGLHAKSQYLDINKKHRTFLYPILGTWGFSPKVNNWLKFLDWYKDSVKDLTFHPIVEGIWPSEWYKIFLKNGKEYTMWEMWHIYHAWKSKELTLYSNFPDTMASLGYLIQSNKYGASVAE
ncbi:hypothetical protein CHS0354_037231 [Potamilus streckersoni]|uniref:Uncharacterized protein n=1 Tax=Potamilus streckersoni TaxID=2493646 RepID=A0AAE0SX79_9BIVA|nr:hypothetical protein CHS0354_037231 [Potamilus streckersoni]